MKCHPYFHMENCVAEMVELLVSFMISFELENMSSELFEEECSREIAGNFLLEVISDRGIQATE